MRKPLIYLTGFMGSGKSTIGPILANTLGWSFYDLDKVIEEEAGKKIKDIFAEKGEPYFRFIETKSLINISKENNVVIALGGGTIVFNENLDFIKNNGMLIYLETSAEVAAKRLLYKRDRPLVNENEDGSFVKLKTKIEGLLAERNKYYYQADIIFNTDKTPIGVTVDCIVKELFKHIKFE